MVTLRTFTPEVFFPLVDPVSAAITNEPPYTQTHQLECELIDTVGTAYIVRGHGITRGTGEIFEEPLSQTVTVKGTALIAALY